MPTDDVLEMRRLQTPRPLFLGRASHRTHAFARHSHDTYVIEVVESGEDRFECGGTVHVARPGDVIVIAPDVPHTGAPGPQTRLVYRSFYPTADQVAAWCGYTQASDAKRGAFDGVTGVVLTDHVIADSLRSVHQSMWNAAATVNGDTLDRLREATCRTLARAASCATGDRARYSPHPAAAKARRFIESHYADPVPLSTLAEVVSTSPWHLQRLFRGGFGLTPHEFLMDCRVRHAREALECGASIADAALATGFCDQSHFTRVFKRHVGTSPGGFVRSLH